MTLFCIKETYAEPEDSLILIFKIPAPYCPAGYYFWNWGMRRRVNRILMNSPDAQRSRIKASFRSADFRFAADYFQAQLDHHGLGAFIAPAFPQFRPTIWSSKAIMKGGKGVVAETGG
jgi:hypothetical protein